MQSRSVVGYARVSSVKLFEEGVSLDTQVAAIKAWASTHGHAEPHIFTAAGRKGNNGERPELEDAINLVCRESGILVAYAMDRLAVSLAVLVRMADSLRTAKADLICLAEKIDSTTPEGLLYLNLLSAIAEFQLDPNSMSITAGMRLKKEHGERTGIVPFGWRIKGNVMTRLGMKPGRLVPAEDEQEVIRRIISMRDTASLREIALWLNQHGVPARQGGWWQASTIRKILGRSAQAKE